MSRGRIWIATTWVIFSRKEGALRTIPLRAGRRRRLPPKHHDTQIKMRWRERNGRGSLVMVSISPENRTSAKPGLDSDWKRGTSTTSYTLCDISWSSAALKISNYFKRANAIIFAKASQPAVFPDSLVYNFFFRGKISLPMPKKTANIWLFHCTYPHSGSILFHLD